MGSICVKCSHSGEEVTAIGVFCLGCGDQKSITSKQEEVKKRIRRNKEREPKWHLNLMGYRPPREHHFSRKSLRK